MGYEDFIQLPKVMYFDFTVESCAEKRNTKKQCHSVQNQLPQCKHAFPAMAPYNHRLPVHGEAKKKEQNISWRPK